MVVYRGDHVHLLTREPRATADYYHRMFDARIVESVQSDGQPRIDLDINGLTLFLFPVAPEAELPAAPATAHLGLDHFGLLVDDLDEAFAELGRRGAVFVKPPRTIRPGVRVAWVQAPDNVRVELLERR